MGFLFPTARITNEGPRLDSLKVTDSAYGNDIPIGFGTVRLGGNIIWATDIREERIKTTRRTGGFLGLGGTKITTITYLYYASFAVAFGEGIASDILRIWADSKVIFDRKVSLPFTTREPTTRIEIIASTLRYVVTKTKDIVFRAYPGDENQLPDPLIIEDKGDDAPSHRGLAYIVFDDMPLKNFGNRLPTITAEINFEIKGEPLIEKTTGALADVAYDAGSIAVDWARERLYLRAAARIDNGVFSLRTLSKIQSLPFSTFRGVIRSTGELVSSNDMYDALILNPYSGKIKKSRANVSGEQMEGSGVGISRSQSGILFKAFISRSQDFRSKQFIFHNLDDLTYLGRVPLESDFTRFIVLADSFANEGIAFGGLFNSDRLVVYRFRVSADVSGAIKDVATPGSGNAGPAPIASRTRLSTVDADVILTLTPSDVNENATTFNTDEDSYGVFDQSTYSYLFGIITDAGRYVLRVNGNGSIEWKTLVPFIRSGAVAEADSRVSGRFWGYFSGPLAFLRINVVTGELDPEFDGSKTFRDADVRVFRGFYDDNLGVSYHLNSLLATGVDRFAIGRRSGSSGRASDIIERISERVGINIVSDSDTSLLDDTLTVDGYIVDARMSAKNAITPLAVLFFIDVVERDGRLVYQPRGTAEKTTIPESDFIRISRTTNEQYTETRVQEAELPVSFNVDYVDVDNDFQKNTARAQRILNPNRTVRSRNSQDTTIPVVMSATLAKQTAEKLLFTAWLERTTYELRLPQKYLYLDPTDACTFSLDNGFSFRGRLDEFDIGKDFSIKLETARENEGQYVSDVVGDGGRVLDEIIYSLTDTEPFYIDSPLLRDFDDFTAGHLVYFAGNNYGQGVWPGCVVSKSPDNSIWDMVLQQVVGVARGPVITTFGNPASYWRTDNENSLDVFMITGEDELESVTELELANGANTAMLLKENGEVGIIQFRTVTSLGDGKFRLNGFLRGRRGTETMERDYNGNEIFIYLGEVEAVTAFAIGLDERSQSRFYKAVTSGQYFEEALTQTFTHTGRDHKPYAPVHGMAERSSGDIILSWTRRTRLGGESDFADGGDGTVPLGESSELYDVIIKNNDGDILRTVENVTTPTYTYTLADSDADGLSSDTVLEIVNPGAENGLNGWTNLTNQIRLSSAFPDATHQARTGTVYFIGWGGTERGDAYQDVNLPPQFNDDIDGGLADITFSGWQNCFEYTGDNDPGGLQVQCYHTDGTILATYTTPIITRGENLVWENVSISGQVPPLTRFFRIHMIGEHNVSSAINAHFDDLSLVLSTGGVVRNISFDVYQKSETVGRGFKGEFNNVEIT